MKWRGVIGGAITVAVLLSFFACSSKSDLSRSKAKEVIEKSAKFTTSRAVFKMGIPGLQAGLQQGLWREFSRDCGGQAPVFILTAKGKSYLEAFDGIINENHANNHCAGPTNGALVLAKPIPPHVMDVTGIADASGMLGPPGTAKNVEFIWKWNLDELPDQLRSVVVAEPKEQIGEALLKLYDDGWRVDEVKLTPQ